MGIDLIVRNKDTLDDIAKMYYNLVNVLKVIRRYVRV